MSTLFQYKTKVSTLTLNTAHKPTILLSGERNIRKRNNMSQSHPFFEKGPPGKWKNRQFTPQAMPQILENKIRLFFSGRTWIYYPFRNGRNFKRLSRKPIRVCYKDFIIPH